MRLLSWLWNKQGDVDTCGNPKELSLIWALHMGKNPKIYSLLVYDVNFILYLHSWLLLTVGKNSGYLGNGQAEDFVLKKSKGIWVEWALPL